MRQEIIKKGRQIETVTADTFVGMDGLLLKCLRVKVRDVNRARKLSASDFEMKNTEVDRKESANAAEEKGKNPVIRVDFEGQYLIIVTQPVSYDGKTVGMFKKVPWEMVSVDPDFSFSKQDVSSLHVDVIEDCQKGVHDFAGISREYALYLPKDEAGNTAVNVPLLVWQIGGGEYNKSLMDAVCANQAISTFADHHIRCGVLIFALSNENYSYSASKDPEKIALIDRNNALQADFIQKLVADGTVDKSRIYCAGASSGGGAVMRFCMQFPELFAGAIPVCQMDPITPIHHTLKTKSKVVKELKRAFQGNIYRWDGMDMKESPVDVERFLQLPMYFVHAKDDHVCKVKSSISAYEARKLLGASDDRIRIYDLEYMKSFGVGEGFATHFAWVPLLADYSEGTPMQWLLSKMFNEMEVN